MAGRPKKQVEEITEKIEMIDSEKVSVAKINLAKFKEKFGADLPHVLYINSRRHKIEKEEIQSDSKLYMILKKEGVMDGDEIPLAE